ncbi:MAG: hypothetical protein WBP26_00445 [Candidatus Saccharimonadales bacterium]
MNFNLNELTQKEVSRKEFLSICALGLGAMVGLSSALQLLTGRTFMGGGKKTSNSSKPGYGNTPYGK